MREFEQRWVVSLWITQFADNGKAISDTTIRIVEFYGDNALMMARSCLLFTVAMLTEDDTYIVESDTYHNAWAEVFDEAQDILYDMSMYKTWTGF